MEARPYQTECLEAIKTGFKEFQKQLVVLPTGSGKTIIFSWLAQSFSPQRTLIIAHRDELIEQAIDKLHTATGIVAEKEKADDRASPAAPVVVASIQTLARRYKRWPPGHFALVVVDEAHHAIANSYRDCLDHFDGSGAKILGVTATPDRLDKKNLGQYFQNIAFELSLFDLVRDGYLCPIKIKSLPIKIDLAGVRTRAGDYSAEDLDKALDPHLEPIAKAIAEHASFRRTLVFLPLVSTSERFSTLCQLQGLITEHVCGESSDRTDIVARFQNGSLDVCTNAMLLTEGFDCPLIDCVVVLRPTQSRALFTQMVGRGTRCAPKKDHLLLLDFLWLHEQHNLIKPAHLVAETQEEAEAMSAESEESGEEIRSLEEIQEKAQGSQEATLRERLESNTKRKSREVDAAEFLLDLHQPHLAEWEDTMPWHSQPVTEKQAALIAKQGIDLASVKSKGHASAIIGQLANRWRSKMASPRQMRLLRRLDHPDPGRATFEEASQFITANKTW